MPRTSERGGPETRRKIAGIASRLFFERGYDSVTVAEVARAAGVSSVTVFKHFPRKEDLFLDRGGDAIDLLRSVITDRDAGVDVVTALEGVTGRLADERHALSGLDPRSAPFFRTVADSPALVARSREIAGRLQAALADELVADESFDGDAILLAAFFVAGYSTVFVENARRMLAGASADELVVDHAARLDRLFGALRSGV